MKSLRAGLTPCFFIALALPSLAETTAELMEEARAAGRAGRFDQAIELATRVIELNPLAPGAFLLRGTIHSEAGRREKAIADYTKAIEFDPELTMAWNRRGMERFKLARIEEAIGDFDRAIELRPALKPHHWQRGIAYYYARRYDEGRKQFELHRTVNPADVENAVWHFLCTAKLEGIESARRAMIPIPSDRRVPMMEIDALFRGRGSVDAVMDAARAGNPSKATLDQRLFYADLYLGLYDEASGNEAEALERIRRAADDYGARHYMGDVARVHMTLAAGKKPR